MRTSSNKNNIQRSGLITLPRANIQAIAQYMNASWSNKRERIIDNARISTAESHSNRSVTSLLLQNSSSSTILIPPSNLMQFDKHNNVKSVADRKPGYSTPMHVAIQTPLSYIQSYFNSYVTYIHNNKYTIARSEQTPYRRTENGVTAHTNNSWDINRDWISEHTDVSGKLTRSDKVAASVGWRKSSLPAISTGPSISVQIDKPNDIKTAPTKKGKYGVLPAREAVSLPYREPGLNSSRSERNNAMHNVARRKELPSHISNDSSVQHMRGIVHNRIPRINGSEDSLDTLSYSRSDTTLLRKSSPLRETSSVMKRYNPNKIVPTKKSNYEPLPIGQAKPFPYGTKDNTTRHAVSQRKQVLLSATENGLKNRSLSPITSMFLELSRNPYPSTILSARSNSMHVDKSNNVKSLSAKKSVYVTSPTHKTHQTHKTDTAHSTHRAHSTHSTHRQQSTHSTHLPHSTQSTYGPHQTEKKFKTY